jgi:hypothetical protein
MMEPSFERAFWALAAADLALWQLDFRTERAMLDERWAQWVGLPAQKDTLIYSQIDGPNSSLTCDN